MAASTTKTKFALTNPVAAGDLLVAGITTSDGGTDPITGVSDSLNGPWTRVTSVKYGNGHVDLYYFGKSAGGIDTVTFTGSQAAFTIAEYSGVQGAPTPLDQFASKSGTGSPAAGPTTQLAGSGELVIGIGGNPAPASSSTQFTAGTGFTLRTQAVIPWNAANGLEDSLSSSNSGQSMTMKSTSSYFGAVVAVFKAPPAASPKAALSVNPASGAAPLSVTADASASTDPIGITSYTFSFGDGTGAGPQAGATAPHTYAAGGTYTAQVTIADASGATATATATVMVGAPVAALTVSPAMGPTPLNVTADASTSTDPIGISRYTFSFGDGSAAVGPQAAATATHTYMLAGAYAATVTVSDSAGATSTAQASVTAVAPPTASLTLSPPAGAAPLTLTADASASSPGSNPIASYNFDFGDQTTSGPQAGSSAVHTCSSGGRYTVKVTVTDTAGNSASTIRTATVGAPAAALSLNPTSGAAPLAVTANASASTDPIGISSYTFNFGDGSPAVGPQAGAVANHTYTAGGTYSATVSVSDSAGGTATTSGTVLVGAPVAALTATPASGAAPLVVTADASASSDAVAISSYTFNFGDGTTVGPQSSATAVHTYSAGGSYTMQVTVTPDTPPAVSAGADANLIQGDTFSQSGSFADPDPGQNWNATVDWGDGGRPRPPQPTRTTRRGLTP